MIWFKKQHKEQSICFNVVPNTQTFWRTKIIINKSFFLTVPFFIQSVYVSYLWGFQRCGGELATSFEDTRDFVCLFFILCLTCLLFRDWYIYTSLRCLMYDWLNHVTYGIIFRYTPRPLPFSVAISQVSFVSGRVRQSRQSKIKTYRKAGAAPALKKVAEQGGGGGGGLRHIFFLTSKIFIMG